MDGGHDAIMGGRAAVVEKDKTTNGCKESESSEELFELLPQELQAFIMEYLPQRDKVEKRLVCKKVQKFIDEYSTFKVEYNAVKDELKDQVLKLRIRSFEISGKHLITQPLSHPLLVKEILFGANVLEETTRRVLSECVNVEVLQCFSTCFSDTTFLGSIDHTKYLQKLRKLKCIILGIFFFSQRSPSFLGKTFKILVGNPLVTFPVISQIRIDYEMTKSEWVDLCKFAGRHKDSLESISISQCVCDFGKSDDETTANLADLNSFALCKLSSIKAVKRQKNCGCRGELFWSLIVNPQKSIKMLWTNLVPSVQHIISFVQKYQATLTSLRMYNVELDMQLQDLTGATFENCVNLRELFLQFNPCAILIIDIGPGSLPPNSGREPRDVREGQPSASVERRFCELTGFHLLPKSLTSLTIGGCLITCADLIEASANLVHLRELRLSDPCSGLLILGTEYGVNKDVILAYMANITFSKLSVHTKFIQRKRNDPANIFGVPELNEIFSILAANHMVEIRGNLMDGIMHENAPATAYKHQQMSDNELRTVEFDIYFNRYEGRRRDLIKLCRGSGGYSTVT